MGLEEEEKKAKKGAAVLGRSGGGVETPSLPPERAPRPTGWEDSHDGPKDPETSKKLASLLASLLRLCGPKGQASQLLYAHLMPTHYSRKRAVSYPSAALEPPTHLQP